MEDLFLLTRSHFLQHVYCMQYAVIWRRQNCLRDEKFQNFIWYQILLCLDEKAVDFFRFQEIMLFELILFQRWVNCLQKLLETCNSRGNTRGSKHSYPSFRPFCQQWLLPLFVVHEPEELGVKGLRTSIKWTWDFHPKRKLLICSCIKIPREAGGVGCLLLGYLMPTSRWRDWHSWVLSKQYLHYELWSGSVMSSPWGWWSLAPCLDSSVMGPLPFAVIRWILKGTPSLNLHVVCAFFCLCCVLQTWGAK